MGQMDETDETDRTDKHKMRAAGKGMMLTVVEAGRPTFRPRFSEAQSTRTDMDGHGQQGRPTFRPRFSEAQSTRTDTDSRADRHFNRGFSEAQSTRTYMDGHGQTLQEAYADRAFDRGFQGRGLRKREAHGRTGTETDGPSFRPRFWGAGSTLATGNLQRRSHSGEWRAQESGTGEQGFGSWKHAGVRKSSTPESVGGRT